ncbi:MAG TPA: alanine--glyoxylate aminotransferase family protein [bacterium]|nr:alanine--glyoxylate aminotransferase family protein [bacterium]
MKERPLLMIPGPVEFEPSVLSALGQPTQSHIDPQFIGVFEGAIKKMREVWHSPSGQPFIVPGTGTLAMEIPAANLVEPEDRVLVVSTGYFGDRYADILSRYTNKVTVLSAPLGGIVETAHIEAELKKSEYRLMTITHVDTSTGVRVDPRPIGKLGHKYGVLTVLDGVCSVAGEELKQDAWELDVVFTASQKAVGVPPGLALVLAGPRAVNRWRKRKSRVPNYYCDWNQWLPVMEAYEAGTPAYFATPAVNHVRALDVSLDNILKEGMEERFQRHRVVGKAFQAGLEALGLKQVPLNKKDRAFTLSAPYYPAGVTGDRLLPQIRRAGVVFAGGLHPEIKKNYFRIGHMGSTCFRDVLASLGALEAALRDCGVSVNPGVSLTAAQSVIVSENSETAV